MEAPSPVARPGTHFLSCSQAPVCQAAQAATTLAAVEWVLFMIPVVLSMVHVWRTRHSNAPEMQTTTV
ncbi:hypothetical protein FB45DRAFT_1021702 [Roridomyces roridus]|uniref:Uncharacterized protein n=1 Tax=Roridomyces roridus TaxID=1738132 RepID=A0AAD7CEQ0_9AGAR|nr:hypothetical protein FB45DRAFT_1021702 [Roridomyces roridus]